MHRRFEPAPPAPFLAEALQQVIEDEVAKGYPVEYVFSEEQLIQTAVKTIDRTGRIPHTSQRQLDNIWRDTWYAISERMTELKLI